MSDDYDEDEAWRNDTWQPADEPCPDCGAAAETCGWWDDAPSNGGACIGTLHKCTKCDWFDSR